MLNLIFDPAHTKDWKILCLGAHGDDLEIGCGGTILRFIQEYQDLNIFWVVFSADENRGAEINRSASLFMEGVSSKKIIIKNFKDGFFPYIGSEIKEFFEELKKKISPDLIFTHYKNDAHQDHRLIAELTWNTWRDHFILEYEVPKYDGDFGRPNFFVNLDEKTANQKIEFLMKCYKSQATKHWFDKDLFRGIMRLRGMECRAKERLAEAFYSTKITL